MAFTGGWIILGREDDFQGLRAECEDMWRCIWHCLDVSSRHALQSAGFEPHCLARKFCYGQLSILLRNMERLAARHETPPTEEPITDDLGQS